MSQLIWNTVEQVRASGVVFSRLVIPVFSFVGLPWMEASFIVTEFPLASLITKYFSVRFPVTPPAGVNFCLAIRWIDPSDGSVVRRKLWEGVTESLDYPLYDGETILTEPVLEIWTVENSSECSLSAAFSLITGIISPPVRCCDNPFSNFNDLATPEHSELFAPFPPPDNFPFEFTQQLEL